MSALPHNPSLIIAPRPHDPQQADWQLYGRDGQRLQQGTDTPLGELAPLAGRARVTVIVPAQWCRLLHVRLPGRQRQHRQAIPFALEDRLADDIEDLHFASGRADAQGAIPVIVTDHRHMQFLRDALETAGIQAERAVSALQCLPRHEDAWSLLWLGPQVVLHQGDEAGMVDSALLAGLLEATADQPAALHHYTAPGTRPALDEGQVHHWPDDDLLGFLAAHCPSRAINLFQGPYQQKDRLAERLRPWKTALAAGVLLALVLTTQQALQWRQLTQQKAQLEARIEQVFRQALPDARRMVNPRAQIKQALAQLNRGQTAPAGFMPLLAALGEPLGRQKGLRLSRLDYSRGQLIADLEAKDYESLQNLQQTLQQQGVAAEILSADSDNGLTRGRLKLTEVRT